MSPAPAVSVAVRARNEAGYVPRIIAALGRQTLPPLEVVYVDHLSTDGTPEMVKRHPGARVVCFGDEPWSYARHTNRALEVCRGEIVAWLNADDTYLSDNPDCRIKPDPTKLKVGFERGGCGRPGDPLTKNFRETWLYYAALADEVNMPPAQLNVAVKDWTKQTVERIFATHLEDWPALLRSLRAVGEEARQKSRKQQTVAAGAGALQ